ncbi:MAG: preprotein translocase subunit SecD [Methanocalculus sp. MSAO_Arc1]|uniref:preprotein translocase subunit SecD n=1 Tax=Methanocalculus TaxID=71151 RepID=UPI000FF08808|nr:MULTISPECIES: preprotein translocase subunit SecD [unclassified Methanocalculus]MCP1661799.1 preprotein translocase subunit SecD [Methanocalculus sp. AMF5]RQD80191.1 MAG: preprotein translocase subunit SecD [Methanocalculus sp. MSAO_Arc1]
MKKSGRTPVHREEQVSLLRDWRIILMIAAIIFAIASIYFLPPAFDKGIQGNIGLGLDLEGGSWIQLEYKAQLVTFETDQPIEELVSGLQKELDTEVNLVEADILEIRKAVAQEDLEPIFARYGATITRYEIGVSEETAETVKRILEEKINRLGTRDATVNTLTTFGGASRYIRVELAGVDMATAQDIVGQQGRFEIRIQTEGDETEHVLFGDAISSVGLPTQQPPGSGSWGVPFTISPEGARAFRQAAIESGATDRPQDHELIMYLDGEVVYSAPLSPDLASRLKVEESRNLVASTGMGEYGMERARVLEIHLRAGALPVDVTIAGSGSVSAALGEHFKMMSIIAGIFALFTVGLVVYYRYREPSIVIPMLLINTSEILILLGIARYFTQLDLAAIAGLIAVLGTSIDQLVVITDEVLHEGKVPSPNVYLKRLSRALGIIIVAAITMIIAMLPLAVMDLSSLRGFAIITIIGVMIGVVITRPAYGKIIMAILSR